MQKLKSVVIYEFVNVKAIENVERLVKLEIVQVNISTLADAYEMGCPIYRVNMNNREKGAAPPAKTGLHSEHAGVLIRRIPNAGIPMDEGT